MATDNNCVVVYSNGRQRWGRSEPLPYPKAMALSTQYREQGWGYVRIEFVPKNRDNK